MTELIDRQAAIDAMVTLLGRVPTNAIRAKDAIEKLPSAQSEQRWIPCSERLPDKNGRYLCTNSRWGAYEVDWNAWINGEWLYQNEEPVAWMPLPEPYVEEGERE